MDDGTAEPYVIIWCWWNDRFQEGPQAADGQDQPVAKVIFVDIYRSVISRQSCVEHRGKIETVALRKSTP